MENKIWYHDELDLTNAVEESKSQAIKEYAALNKQLIIYFWETKQMSELRKSIQYGSAELNYFKNWLSDSSSEERLYLVYILGNLSGILESIDRNLYQDDQAVLASEIAEKRMAAATKHLSEIVVLLETHGVMTHSELCKALNMNASTLSEAMKKILQTEFVKASSYGKYKLYNLTELGHRYGKSLRKQKAENREREELFAKLNMFLQNSDDSNLKSNLTKLLSGKAAQTICEGDTVNVIHRESAVIRKERYHVDMILLESNLRPENEITISCSKKETFLYVQSDLSRNDWQDFDEKSAIA